MKTLAIAIGISALLIAAFLVGRAQRAPEPNGATIMSFSEPRRECYYEVLKRGFHQHADGGAAHLELAYLVLEWDADNAAAVDRRMMRELLQLAIYDDPHGTDACQDLLYGGQYGR